MRASLSLAHAAATTCGDARRKALPFVSVLSPDGISGALHRARFFFL